MMNLIKRIFHNWNELKCPKCGGRETDSIVRDRIDHIVCEEEIVCSSCEAFRNYWAYGSYELPQTKTEVVAYKWYFIKSRVRKFYKRGSKDWWEM